MKNQIIKNKYFVARDAFNRQRLFFNMKVEEKLQEEGKDEILKSVEYDSYENAKFLMEFFPEIPKLYNQVKAKNSNYGTERIKKIIIDSYKELSQENLDNYFYGYSFETILDSYLLYESCGYFKVLKKEQQLQKEIIEIEMYLNNLSNHSKNKIIKMGIKAKKIIKPYKNLTKEKCKDVYKKTRILIRNKNRKLSQRIKNINL